MYAHIHIHTHTCTRLSSFLTRARQLTDVILRTMHRLRKRNKVYVLFWWWTLTSDGPQRTVFPFPGEAPPDSPAWFQRPLFMLLGAGGSGHACHVPARRMFHRGHQFTMARRPICTRSLESPMNRVCWPIGPTKKSLEEHILGPCHQR